MKNLKKLLVILCVVVARGTQLQLTSPLDQQLNALLEQWRAGTIHQCSPVPLPSLDLIRIPSYEGTLDQKGIKMSYVMGPMQVAGLADSIVNDVTTSVTEGQELSASVTATIPALTLSSDNYRISGTAYFLYPIKGSGVLTITLYDVIIRGDVWLKPLENGTKVNDLKLKFTVGKVNANLQGSTWPINTVLTREGAAIISMYHDEITIAAQNALTARADRFLEKIPPAVLVKHVADTAFCKDLDKTTKADTIGTVLDDIGMAVKFY